MEDVINVVSVLSLQSPSILSLYSVFLLSPPLFKKKKRTGIGEVEQYSDLNSNAVVLMSTATSQRLYILQWSHSLQHFADTNSVDPVGNLMQIVLWMVNGPILCICGLRAEGARNGFRFLPKVAAFYKAAQYHGAVCSMHHTASNEIWDLALYHNSVFITEDAAQIFVVFHEKGQMPHLIVSTTPHNRPLPTISDIDLP